MCSCEYQMPRIGRRYHHAGVELHGEIALPDPLILSPFPSSQNIQMVLAVPQVEDTLHV
jgi:hypothetical protein